MKKKQILTGLICSLYSASALAASPLPTFDKEAVTTQPYNRTGEQNLAVE